MTRIDYRLNAIVDSGLRDVGDLAELARVAAQNGATVIQYRDKQSSMRDMVGQATSIREALSGSGVPLLINDRVDVALAAGADGVHLGRDDIGAELARLLLGPDALIGVTVKNETDADAAARSPVDYACIGGVYETLSKHNPDPPVGAAGFAALRARLTATRPDLPVGAIAGIDAARATEIVSLGASGVAVISAIFRAADIAASTRALRRAVDDGLRSRTP
jgi:thiamine-phosphate pyrophosphorylase